MKILFYAFAFFPIIFEMVVASKPQRMVAFVERFKDIKEGDDEYYKKITVSIFMMFYMVWTFIGLFTFQWWAFAFLFVISVIPKKVAWLKCIDALVTLAVLIFIVINAFHLRIDLF